MIQWRCGVVIISTAQLHSTKPELSPELSSSPARGVSGVSDNDPGWK